MSVRCDLAAAMLFLACASAACSNSSTQPSTSDTASVTIPVGLSPANSSRVSFNSQPVSLTVRNAVATRSTGTTYAFEVATDPGFGNKVQTPANISEGANGQTTAALAPLAASTDYYWHARATTAGTTGPFSATLKFTVGPAIIINPPVPIGPLNGTQTRPRPTFRVTNSARTGPAGAITYRFEISTNSAFTAVISTATQPEGVNETGFIPNNDLPINIPLYWRATAIDAVNGVTSAPSAFQTFTTRPPSQADLVADKLGVPLWGGVQPPGTNGHATLGSFWNVEYITSFNGVTFLNPPLDELQIFDLLDRGMDPQSAITWMNSNGYPTQGAYYPSVQVIGFAYEYMAYVAGAWDLVLKVGA